jgi:carbon-monoxide dehydrogenase large subunit
MGYPREWSKITVKPDGEVEVAIGTLSSGQGHETSFAQCVSEWLAVPFEQVKLVQGDTDIVPVGGGSHSGRSMRFASIVMGTCSNAIIARQSRFQGRALPQRVIAAVVRRVRNRARRAGAQRPR